MADFDQTAKGGPFAKFSKWPIFLALCKGFAKCKGVQRVQSAKCKGCKVQSAKGPFAKFSKWPIFLAELRKLQKIGNTSPILA